LCTKTVIKQNSGSSKKLYIQVIVFYSHILRTGPYVAWVKGEPCATFEYEPQFFKNGLDMGSTLHCFCGFGKTIRLYDSNKCFNLINVHLNLSLKIIIICIKIINLTYPWISGIKFDRY